MKPDLVRFDHRQSTLYCALLWFRHPNGLAAKERGIASSFCQVFFFDALNLVVLPDWFLTT